MGLSTLARSSGGGGPLGGGGLPDLTPARGGGGFARSGAILGSDDRVEAGVGGLTFGVRLVLAERVEWPLSSGLGADRLGGTSGSLGLGVKIGVWIGGRLGTGSGVGRGVSEAGALRSGSSPLAMASRLRFSSLRRFRSGAPTPGALNIPMARAPADLSPAAPPRTKRALPPPFIFFISASRSAASLASSSSLSFASFAAIFERRHQI